MSYVMAAPELMEAAATDLATIGSTLNTAHMEATASTVAVLPAAADEVSTSIAHLMSGYGQEYQKLAGQAAAFHEQFVQRLTGSAESYASAEAANLALLQPVKAIADAPASAAASIPTGQELGSQIISGLFTILIGVPVVLIFVGLAIFFPGVLRGLGVLINGRG